MAAGVGAIAVRAAPALPGPELPLRASGAGTLRRLLRHPSALVGGILLGLIVLGAVGAPLLAPVDPLTTDPGAARLAPEPAHPLGTDHLGRDLLSRVLYGGRVSLVLGAAATLLGGLAGTLLGLCAGYFRGPTDTALMLGNDILLAFPGFLLALGAVAVLGIGMANVAVAVGISLVPTFARVIRGTALTTRELEYVQAARVIGAGHLRTMFRHVLPNAVAPAIVLATVGVGGAILTAASLSFVGVGAQPPAPEWGLMVNEGRRYLRLAGWVSAAPGLAIMVTVVAINLLGDGLRDILDPRLRI
jgi:peptide/nickel transport system permease protein